MNKLLVVCGPTATGKTKLAVHLAKKFDGELVSADSRQVYRGMDIGTGKDIAEVGNVPIWMIDVVDPNKEFSVSHWVTLATRAISDIHKRQKLPIVVGGTGFYINALLHPFETIDIPPNRKLRNRLQKSTISQLQQLAKGMDMNPSDWQNPRRLIRKIEIRSYKGAAVTVHGNWDTLQIGLTAPLPALYKRIDERVDERMRQGMADEIAKLIKTYGRDIPAMKAPGYRSLEHWKYDEHGYARRQMTWFRKIPDICWFDITKPDIVRQVTKKVAAWYTKGEMS